MTGSLSSTEQRQTGQRAERLHQARPTVCTKAPLAKPCASLSVVKLDQIWIRPGSGGGRVEFQLLGAIRPSDPALAEPGAVLRMRTAPPHLTAGVRWCPQQTEQQRDDTNEPNANRPDHHAPYRRQITDGHSLTTQTASNGQASPTNVRPRPPDQAVDPRVTGSRVRA